MTTVSEKAEQAKEFAASKLHDAQSVAGDAYAATRDKASDAYQSTRSALVDAGQKTAEAVDANPTAALIGGVALGVIVGMLLPRSEAEAKALGGLGARLNDAARGAVSAARDAGRDSLADMGFTPDAARAQAQKFVESVVAAATSAGSAAAKAAKEQAQA
jgi:ElaB/YqjD/DUF883 family membrane-anchored ribosome-binding protein